MSTQALERHEPGEIQQARAPRSALDLIAMGMNDPTFDVGKLQMLVQLHREMQTDAARIEFAAAKARVQMAVPRVSKNGMIIIPGKDGKEGHRTPYALYEDIDKVLRPLLAEEGFSFSFDALADGQRIIVKLRVSHKLGHVEESSLPLAIDASGSKNATQAIVSTNSYGKRVLICNWANIITEGKDDDGAGQGAAPITDTQAMTLNDMMVKCQMSPGQKAKFFAHVKANTIEEITSGRFDQAKAALQRTIEFNQGAHDKAR